MAAYGTALCAASGSHTAKQKGQDLHRDSPDPKEWFAEDILIPGAVGDAGESTKGLGFANQRNSYLVHETKYCNDRWVETSCEHIQVEKLGYNHHG